MIDIFNHMMDVLACFYNNGYLFKCSSIDFDDVIKNNMNRIMMIHNCSIDSEFNHENVNMTHCMICFQYVGNFKHFTICEQCCNSCINKRVRFIINAINSYPSFWCYDNTEQVYSVIQISDYDIYFPESHNKAHMLNHFVNNLYRLKHRFYHETPIMLLLSIYDPKSSCYQLNHDIIFHMLKFIY